jgi:predicted CXXCH cytochrome family protein
MGQFERTLIIADKGSRVHYIEGCTAPVYTSDSLDANDVTQPDGQSKLCLSCHDGTVAVDNFGGTTTGTTFVTGNALLDTNLGNDHPISFTYNSALATLDGGLEDPSTATSGLGSTIDADMLFGGSLECASCHDVHDNTIAPFLRVSNSGSALCLTCHIK